MTITVSTMTDAEFRSRNADINSLGKGLLWGLLVFVPPAFFYGLARRIFPSINPTAAAIGGSILAVIPFVNALLGIVLFIYASKRIGRGFISGQIALYVIFVVVTLGLVIGLSLVRE